MSAWIFVAIGAIGGGCVGVIVTALAFGRIQLENEQMRSALRYFRGVAIRDPELRPSRRYIDHLLDDEAGA